MVRIPTNRQPTHPGEMLLEEFLSPMEITQRDLADAIHVPYQTPADWNAKAIKVDNFCVH